MPSRVLRAARFTDAQVMAFLEAVMRRWPTNAPLLAVGGFSYSFPSEEWRRAVAGTESFLVSSAALSADDASFGILFRRSRNGHEPDEIELSWRDADQGFADGAELEALADGISARATTAALPAPR